ncbi:MAG: dTDP-4-dehydrorhamnose 3,5-epimerase [Rhodoglobus sp.]|nr:dTDP-4-dehydrorhamnose 3,5-epimerase [Rhodoglobus sp.]
MHIRELTVRGAFEVTPTQHSDERGVFLEWYRFDRLEEAVGHSLDLRQANTSVSRRGVVRGIHFADVPPGQAKYVTVTHGSVLDFVVDLRVGSPTFGTWDSVLLDAVDRRAVYIPEGLGHAFVALSDEATATYLVSDTYNPGVERSLHARDGDVGLVFPDDIGELEFSPKDADAPSLAELIEQSLLPKWSAAQAHYELLNKGGS